MQGGSAALSRKAERSDRRRAYLAPHPHGGNAQLPQRRRPISGGPVSFIPSHAVIVFSRLHPLVRVTPSSLLANEPLSFGTRFTAFRRRAFVGESAPDPQNFKVMSLPCPIHAMTDPALFPPFFRFLSELNASSLQELIDVFVAGAIAPRR